MDQSETFSDLLIADSYVSIIVCSCRWSFSESLTLSEVAGLIISNIIGENGSPTCSIIFSIGSSSSLISVSFKNADCSNSVLVFCLIGFLYWLSGGLKALKEIESSG